MARRVRTTTASQEEEEERITMETARRRTTTSCLWCPVQIKCPPAAEDNMWTETKPKMMETLNTARKKEKRKKGAGGGEEEEEQRRGRAGAPLVTVVLPAQIGFPSVQISC